MIIEHNEHPIERIMDNAFTRIKGLVSADTIIGNPVKTEDGSSIIPVSRVTMGFLTGGGEYSDLTRESNSEYPFAGGSGAGFSVSPIGFAVIDKGKISLTKIEPNENLEKLIQSLPEIACIIADKISTKKP